MRVILGAVSAWEKDMLVFKSVRPLPFNSATRLSASAAVVPEGAGSHMFDPEWLLSQLLSQMTDPNSKSPTP